MRMTVTPLMDFIVSAAREACRPTLVVRVSNEGGAIRIDDELGMLPEEARACLKRDEIAIVEFKCDSELETVFDRVKAKDDADTSALSVSACMIPSAGRPKEWSTSRWL